MMAVIMFMFGINSMEQAQIQEWEVFRLNAIYQPLILLSDIATATAAALTAAGYSTNVVSNQVTFTTLNWADQANSSNNMGAGFSQTLTNGGIPSPYFNLDSDGYSFIYNIDGNFGLPDAAYINFETIDILSSDTATEVANKTALALQQPGNNYDPYMVTNVANVLYITQFAGTAHSDQGSNFTFGTATALGDFYVFYEPSITANKVVWFNVSGAYAAPYAPNLIVVNILSTDTAIQVAAKL